MRKERMIDVIKVVNFLQNNPNSHLREISRLLKMNPSVVHSTLKDISDFIVMRSINDEINLNLPNLPIMIRLKEGVTAEGILRYLRIKQKLG